MSIKNSTLSLFILFASLTYSQEYYVGNDLSYVTMMEDCGADFKENGLSKDPYQIFVDHGTNLVRVRLWHNPSWQNTISQPTGVRSQYSDFTDAKESIQRAKAVGSDIMLGLHFSDAWADPGRQVIPAAWVDVATNLTALKDSVYNYMIKTLSDLHKDNLLPEIIKVGNEANPGMMVYKTMDENLDPSNWISGGWARQAQLYNAAIKAVRDFSDTTEIKPLISLHCADPAKTLSWYNNIISNGVTDFDIIGFSYYYSWHGSSIPAVGNVVKQLKSYFPDYEVMIVETGYLWTTKNYDELGNIINTPDPDYLPVSPQKQLEYMVDLQRAVLNNGGIGCIFWEPAWVSTPCRTLWGHGSSHDHVVFFDYVNNNFMKHGGGRWMEPRFYENTNSPKITFKVNMTGQGYKERIYLKGSWSDEFYPMVALGDNMYSYPVYELNEGDSVGFYFTYDTINIEGRETVPASCALWNSTDRVFVAGASDETIEMYWESCNDQPPVNLNKTTVSDKLFITPNPCDELVTIKFEAKQIEQNIQIFDLNGKLYFQDVIAKNKRQKSLDISFLVPGVYLIKLCNGTEINQHRLLVI